MVGSVAASEAEFDLAPHKSRAGRGGRRGGGCAASTVLRMG
jgi:hypothetical protein